jgi:hypothetical protein
MIEIIRKILVAIHYHILIPFDGIDIYLRMNSALPRDMTVEQNQTLIQKCRELLAIHNDDRNGFLARLVTRDESWFYYYKTCTLESVRTMLKDGLLHPPGSNQKYSHGA